MRKGGQVAAPAFERLAEDRDAGFRGSVSAFVEVLEAKAGILELTGSGSVAADLRKWATELRHRDSLYNFIQGGN